MGTIKFQVASPDFICAARLKHSYAVDAMLVAYAVETSIADQVITVELPRNDSCHIFFPWPAADGDLMLCTTSLRISDRPYDYEMELARGTVGRLLAKLAFWREPEIRFSEMLLQLIGQCQAKLIEAVFQADVIARADAACAAIDLAVASTQVLVEEYVNQVSPGKSSMVPVSFGVVCQASEFNDNLPDQLSGDDTARLKADDTQRLSVKSQDCPGATSALLGQIDTVFLPLPGLLIDSNISQALVQIANETRKLFKRFNFSSSQATDNPCSALAPGVGPILDWASEAIDQLFRTEKEFERIRDSLYVLSKTIVENLPRPVNSFYVAAGVGARRDKKFDDHQRLQLTLDAMCGIYKSAPDLPLLVSFHQPIGGEIDNDPRAISPLHGADALLRADTGLRMIGLEISFANGELPSTRELLQVNELVDVWSQFGLPLFVVLTLAPYLELRQDSTRQVARREKVRMGVGAQRGPLPAVTAVQHREAAKHEFDYGELLRVVSLLQSKSAVRSLFFSAADMPADSHPESRERGWLAFQAVVARVISESKSSKT